MICFTPTKTCPFECVDREKRYSFTTQRQKKYHVECKVRSASGQLKRPAKKKSGATGRDSLVIRTTNSIAMPVPSTTELAVINPSDIPAPGQNDDSFGVQASSRLGRFTRVITYPIMFMLTLILTMMAIIFCIFPMFLCMTFAVCIYYCIMDDPIPLSSLLRYLLTPDPEDPFHQPSTLSRTAIQARLIVRKVLAIDVTPEGEGQEMEVDKEKEYARRRNPATIELQTRDKRIYFSEPILYEEKAEKDGDSRDEFEDNVPPYYRSDISGDANYGDSTSQAANPAPRIHDLNSLQDLSDALATPPDDIEIGLVEFVIDAVDSFETAEIEVAKSRGVAPLEPATPALSTLESDSKPKNSEDPLSTSNECKSASLEDDSDMKQSVPLSPTPSEPQGRASKVVEQLEEAAEIVSDYFGIAADSSRDRGTACDICLLDFEIGEEVAWSTNAACTHSFHKDCIMDWLVRKPSCPSCRQNYLEIPRDEANHST